MSYTKGPWGWTHNSGNYGHTVFSRDIVIAKTPEHKDDKDHDENQANAALIAAAPELLEACKEFVRKVECGEARSKRSYAQMKAAIAKAEVKP